MKKFLNFISALAGVAVLSSSVVSCGVSTDSLMKKRIDPTQLSSAYYYPIDTWSPTLMVGTWDYEILSDTQGTLVRTNRYDESIGELALSYSSEILHKGDGGYLEYGGTVGKPGHNDNLGVSDGGVDKTSWTYYLNPKAHWSTYDGVDKGQIHAQDFANTIFMALDPTTQTQNSAFLSTIFDNGEIAEVTNAFNKYRDDKKNPTIDEEGSPMNLIKKYFIKIGEDCGQQPDGSFITYETVSFLLSKTCNFFDTVLTTEFYAPTPDFSIEYQYINDAVGFYPTSKALQNYGLNYKTPWYSGAYTPTSYSAGGDIELKENKNYVDRKNVNIKKLKYTFISQAYPNKERVMFEAGDINDAKLTPSDQSGWDTYVGENPATPNFTGTSSTFSTDATTRVILFNFADLENDGSGYSKIRNSATLQSAYVRAYIEYYLNRSYHTSYFSNGKSGKDTSYIRNTMVPRNFAVSRDSASNSEEQDIDDITKDYADIFSENGVKQVGNGIEDTFFDDGNDAFYKNNASLTFKDKFVVNKESFEVNNAPEEKHENNLKYAYDPDVKDVANLVKDVMLDIDQINNIMHQDGMINLKYIISSADINTVAQSTIQMLNSFNKQAKVDGVPINIYPVISSSADEYLQWRNKGAYDIMSSGWQPDFADPSSYLETMTYGGSFYKRWGGESLFSPEAFSDLNKEVDPDIIDPDFFTTCLNDFGKKMVEANAAPINIYKLYVSVFYYTKYYNEANAETASVTERYKKFANVEFNLIYRNMLLMPLGIQDGDYKVKLTFVRPRTTATVAYGSSRYKHVGVLMSDHLLNAQERQIVENNFQQELKYRREVGA